MGVSQEPTRSDLEDVLQQLTWMNATLGKGQTPRSGGSLGITGGAGTRFLWLPREEGRAELGSHMDFLGTEVTAEHRVPQI